MSKKIIEIKKITKKFGNKVANRNISFSIKKGEKIGIIGANGAGKTTFVEQLIGTYSPSSGKIKYLFPFKKTPQEKMGMQFQESSYPEGISVKDVIEFSLSIYKSAINSKELKELIDIFQINYFIHSKAKSLSGGQQQKLNVLLAIAHNPEIVILDEISTGLDVAAREEILNYVESIINKQKITTILISHHMSEIERICDRAIILHKGEIILDSSINKIRQKYKGLEFLMRSIMKKGKHAII